MIHIYRESKKSKRILVLFHGTGGDEHDMIPLACEIDPSASILSLRGNVSEEGMLRFFERLSSTKFNQESIKLEAQGIYTFLMDFIKIHGRSVTDLVFVGFSNGANMIVALLFLYPKLVRYALILHGLQPLERLPHVSLGDSRVFVSLGDADRMITPAQTLSLVSALRSKGVDVTVYRDSEGHTISSAELVAASEFLAKLVQDE